MDINRKIKIIQIILLIIHRIKQVKLNIDINFFFLHKFYIIYFIKNFMKIHLIILSLKIISFLKFIQDKKFNLDKNVLIHFFLKLIIFFKYIIISFKI